jgi:hypothetical protein
MVEGSLLELFGNIERVSWRTLPVPQSANHCYEEYQGDIVRDDVGVGAGEAGTGEAGAGEAFSTALSIAFTSLRSRRVTMPRRRYQLPSPVSQTSSASTLVPSVRRIVTGARPALGSPLVDTSPGFRGTRAGSA